MEELETQNIPLEHKYKECKEVIKQLEKKLNKAKDVLTLVVKFRDEYKNKLKAHDDRWEKLELQMKTWEDMGLDNAYFSVLRKKIKELENPVEVTKTG